MQTCASRSTHPADAPAAWSAPAEDVARFVTFVAFGRLTPLHRSVFLAMLLAATIMPGTALAQNSPQNQRFTIVFTDVSGTDRIR